MTIKHGLLTILYSLLGLAVVGCEETAVPTPSTIPIANPILVDATAPRYNRILSKE